MQTDKIEVLERLARLHETGALSASEFEAQKREVLGSAAAEPPPAAPPPPAPEQSQGSPVRPSLKSRLEIGPGLASGLFLSATYVGDAALCLISAVAGADARAQSLEAAIALVFAGLTVALGWWSTSRRSLIGSPLLLAWCIGDIALVLTGTHVRAITKLVLLPDGIALIAAVDAIVFAFATRKARKAGLPPPPSNDRWGAESWFSKRPAAVVAVFLCVAVFSGIVQGLAFHDADTAETAAAPQQASSVTTSESATAAGAVPPAATATPAVAASPTLATTASSTAQSPVSPGALGWPARDPKIDATSPAENLRQFRHTAAHPGDPSGRIMAWDEVVEQQEGQRTLFYSVVTSAPQLVTPNDVGLVRDAEHGIIEEDCMNQDAETRQATYPALTDAFCKSQPNQ